MKIKKTVKVRQLKPVVSDILGVRLGTERYTAFRLICNENGYSMSNVVRNLVQMVIEGEIELR